MVSQDKAVSEAKELYCQKHGDETVMADCISITPYADGAITYLWACPRCHSMYGETTDPTEEE